MTDNFNPTEWITTKEAAELMVCQPLPIWSDASNTLLMRWHFCFVNWQV